MTIKKGKWRSSLKVLPKTLSDSFLADCGHTFSYRIPLNNFAGLEASEENWTQLEKIFEKERKIKRLSPCPECTAKINLDTYLSSQKIFFNFIKMEPLRPLEGTIRQRSYAENVRYSFIVEPLRTLQRSIVLSEDLAISKLSFLSMKNLGEKYGVLGKNYYDSVDLESLRRNFEATQMEHIFNPIKNPDLILSFWLVARRFWEEELKYVGWQENVKTWIAKNNRNPKRLHMTTVASAQRFLENHWQDLNAAILLSQLADWETCLQAESAYKLLTEEDLFGSNLDILIQILENNSCSTWSEAFDMAAVWKVLSK